MEEHEVPARSWWLTDLYPLLWLLMGTRWHVWAVFANNIGVGRWVVLKRG